MQVLRPEAKLRPKVQSSCLAAFIPTVEIWAGRRDLSQRDQNQALLLFGLTRCEPSPCILHQHRTTGRNVIPLYGSSPGPVWRRCAHISSQPPNNRTLERAGRLPSSSFGEPGTPQCFFVSRDVFGTPIRSQHAFEVGNPQCRIELAQAHDRLLRLTQPSRHRIARSANTQ